MDLDRAVAELETLVETLEREGDERALLLLQLVDAIHRPALERIAAGDLEHPLARGLLAMYDLVPVDEWIQAEEALDAVRPYVDSHGGALELLAVEDGVVRVRLAGACHGCSGSATTLRRGVEAALRERFPGFRRLEAEEPEQPEGPLLQVASLRRPVFVEALALEAVGAGELHAVAADGVPVLLASVEGEVYAFRNACPVDGLPLEGGRLTGTVLVCPWHNCAFDARTGKRVDDEGERGLAVVPVAVQEGSVLVAVNVA